jgi:hypothetical protein
MEQYTGTMLNWSLALGGYAVGGVLWAVIVFLGIAVVRLALEVQRLRRANAELSRGVSPRDQFNDTGFREAPPSNRVPLGTEPVPSRA